MVSLETARLRLVPFAPAHLLALIDGKSRFEELSGLRAAPGLREFYTSGEVSPAWIESLRAAGATDPWVHGFAVIRCDGREVIGAAGYKGPPDEEGAVEIGYGIVPGCQGQGFATEAAAALVECALADGRVRTVRAHTAPEENASTRVLAKCGFAWLGEVIDPEDGPVWRWELARGRESGGSPAGGEPGD